MSITKHVILFIVDNESRRSSSVMRIPYGLSAEATGCTYAPQGLVPID